MLLPDNIHPENTVYYNGAFVLQELQSARKLSILDLYQRVKQSRNMTFSLFVLCLDWLYLISAAEINKSGEIELCS
jgi:hypothetical protein